MATTTRTTYGKHGRVSTPVHIPSDHYGPEKGKGFVEVRQTDRSKAYASNRTKPKRKK